jgi:hypothetical protein
MRKRLIWPNYKKKSSHRVVRRARGPMLATWGTVVENGATLYYDPRVNLFSGLGKPRWSRKVVP